ncbi:hypothetical protein GCM10017788_20350 [Amycolatopsis acidiphila]|nr:hypothetical protein GCM10017788_20350 [Amycolatopsis acidiphila]
MAPSALFDEENQDHNHTIWHLSDGQDGDKGGWTRELDYLMEPPAPRRPGDGAEAGPGPVRDVCARYPADREG